VRIPTTLNQGSFTTTSGINKDMFTTAHSRHQQQESGFSLVELMVAIAIVGILASVAMPQYFNQVQKTRQNQAATTVSQVQTTIAAFVDEMGLLPTSWSDLDKITPLMTPDGPANQSNFTWVTLASDGCSRMSATNCYEITASEKDQIFTLQARPTKQDALAFNVVACLDLRTGSSDLRKGTDGDMALVDDLRCERNES
jgi:prepilin-type N-terminal cleavage/methylation domain-containing protein